MLSCLVNVFGDAELPHSNEVTAPGNEPPVSDAAKAPPQSTGAKICSYVGLSALAGSIGWAFGWHDVILALISDHGFAVSVGVALFVAVISSFWSNPVATFVSWTFAIILPVLIVYGIASSWSVIAATGSYYGIPFLVDTAPGVAINVSVAMLTLCKTWHGLSFNTRLERWTTSIFLSALASGIVFAMFIVISFLPHDFARIQREVEQERQAVTQEDLSAIAAGEWKCVYGGVRTQVQCADK